MCHVILDVILGVCVNFCIRMWNCTVSVSDLIYGIVQNVYTTLTKIQYNPVIPNAFPVYK